MKCWSTQSQINSNIFNLSSVYNRITLIDTMYIKYLFTVIFCITARIIMVFLPVPSWVASSVPSSQPSVPPRISGSASPFPLLETCLVWGWYSVEHPFLSHHSSHSLLAGATWKPSNNGHQQSQWFSLSIFIQVVKAVIEASKLSSTLVIGHFFSPRTRKKSEPI